ncbi:MAG: hypothetical protein CMB01_00145 [Euryarchaeota archaeon]|nr:hypothetical protein [Euryarchaeota archaeon]MCH2641079.1 hypothetical protein [Candidatus Thalassarchaeum sp.]
MRTPARGRCLCVVAMFLLVSLSPTVAAEVSVTLSSDSSSKEASPGSPAEYTITVRNTGDEEMTVSLATSQEPGGCQGYSSTVEQVPGTIAAGSYEQVTLTVNVTEGDQTADDCETTVTATASAAEPGTPGAPAQGDVAVTTTLGEGSGNAAQGVELSTSQATKNYNNGAAEVEWEITVKNTGQTQETITLEMDDSSSCRSDGLEATVDPAQVTLNSDDEETVTVTVEVPDGEQTEAGSHCFITRATVSAPAPPPGTDPAQDNLSVTLNIPELHECTATLSPSSMTIAPGASQSGNLVLTNDGNSDWTVGFGKSGAKANWVTPEVSQRSLPYDNGNGQAAISFDVTPDDSMAANTATEIRIRGLDGNNERCYAILTVTVGQSYGASASLGTNYLTNVEPGTADSTSLTVTNQGNGADTFSIAHSPVPSGWTVTMSSTSVNLLGKHEPQADRQESVSVEVFVPIDALADDSVTISFTVTSGGDSSIQITDSVEVSVAERHEVGGSVLSIDQTGRSDQKVDFPVIIQNNGNVQDSFRLRACDPNQPGSGCTSPSWQSIFVDDQDNEVTQISLDAGASQQVYLRIHIQSEDEGDYLQVLIKVNIVSAPSNEFTKTVTARVSNYDYMMQLILAEPQGAPDSTSVTLPPGGESTISMLVSDVGTSPYIESALFTTQGMDSTITTTLRINGIEVGIGTTPYEIPDDSQVYNVSLTFSVMGSDQGLNGEAGVVKVCAASMRNTANPSCVDVVITIETVHKLEVVVQGGPNQNTTHPEFSDFLVEVTNSGNIEEQIEITSTEGLRGWTVDIEQTDLLLYPGETETIRVRVKPPVDLPVEDEFEFTLIVTPDSCEVCSQPVDMSVKATHPETPEWVNYMLWSVFGTLLLGILVTIMLNRRRSFGV